MEPILRYDLLHVAVRCALYHACVTTELLRSAQTAWYYFLLRHPEVSVHWAVDAVRHLAHPIASSDKYALIECDGLYRVYDVSGHEPTLRAITNSFSQSLAAYQSRVMS